MPKDINLSLSNDDSIAKIAAALDSKIRRIILAMVTNERYSIMEIAEKLNIPLSTLSTHIKMLSDAHLISITQNLSKRGKEKLISRGVNQVTIDLSPHETPLEMSAIFNIPLGSFTDCTIKAPCGLADENGIVINDDNPSAFYSPDRLNAQIIWFSDGNVEYRIPNYMLKGKSLKSILVSCELCSECPDFNVEWRSDITFWINGHEICTYECPGDMGGRHGKFSPSNWSRLATQFGFLKNILIDENGSFLDQARISATKISRLNLQDNDFISLKIGIKEGAKYVGGINLFGEKFGDYPQGLVVKIDWQ